MAKQRRSSSARRGGPSGTQRRLPDVSALGPRDDDAGATQRHSSATMAGCTPDPPVRTIRSSAEPAYEDQAGATVAEDRERNCVAQGRPGCVRGAGPGRSRRSFPHLRPRGRPRCARSTSFTVSGCRCREAEPAQQLVAAT